METEKLLTEHVIGAAIEVHRIMGPGLLESIYQRCLEHELALRGISFQAQVPVAVNYKGINLGDDLVMDFFFPPQLVVEIKTVDELAKIHSAQILSYMRLSRASLGLLINFNVPLLKDGIQRFRN